MLGEREASLMTHDLDWIETGFMSTPFIKKLEAFP
jgi:hypothetical protein